MFLDLVRPGGFIAAAHREFGKVVCFGHRRNIDRVARGGGGDMMHHLLSLPCHFGSCHLLVIVSLDINPHINKSHSSQPDPLYLHHH